MVLKVLPQFNKSIYFFLSIGLRFFSVCSIRSTAWTKRMALGWWVGVRSFDREGREQDPGWLAGRRTILLHLPGGGNYRGVLLVEYQWPRKYRYNCSSPWVIELPIGPEDISKGCFRIFFSISEFLQCFARCDHWFLAIDDSRDRVLYIYITYRGIVDLVEQVLDKWFHICYVDM